MIAANPLQWPNGWPRTKSYARQHGRFSSRARTKHRDALTVAEGVERVLLELSRLGIGRDDIVISTNVPTRLDGLPRSDARAPDDPGCAVYWQTRHGTRRVMAIDRYLKVADNLAAVAATLDALRAIERHGGAQILDRAFTGFTTLPSPGAPQHWREVIGVPPHVHDISAVRDEYRRRAAQHHPDRPGGSHDAMTALNVALGAAERELGGTR
ncbi:J domain-containing protein [Paraburkholderia sp.]|uniref:J domain-containing protein n=1 Tax=Paraburkholderia sp. TaxID=1926495 RepID=UPI0025CD6608|nr:J domain-containing protein [Paraburkholderia sp.]